MYAEDGNYIDLECYHVQAQQEPTHETCYITRQDTRPTNWLDHEYGPWEPMNILFYPKVPSRNRSGMKFSCLHSFTHLITLLQMMTDFCFLIYFHIDFFKKFNDNKIRFQLQTTMLLLRSFHQVNPQTSLIPICLSGIIGWDTLVLMQEE